MGEENTVNHRKLLNGLEVVIHVSPENDQIVIKGIEEIYKFFEKESEFWEQSSHRNIGFISTYLSHYSKAVSQLDSFRNSFENLDENQFNQRWRSIHNLISQQSVANYKLFYSITPHGKFLFELAQQNPEEAEAACQFFINDRLHLTIVRTFFSCTIQ